MELYQPFPSSAKNKKYSVYVIKDNKRRLIHFGDSRYGQFKDKLGHYSHLDHNDKARRASYYKRHGPTTDKNTSRYYVNLLDEATRWNDGKKRTYSSVAPRPL